jgi:glycerol uptake facilitator-like aquaporin
MVKNPITVPTQNGYLGGFTVGICLLTCITLCGGHTGAAINPAVGLAQVIYTDWQEQTDEYWAYLWIYTAGPYLGGILAGLFHHMHVYSTEVVCNDFLDANEADTVMYE